MPLGGWRTGTETIRLIKENGNWLIYGNQQKYGVEAWTGHRFSPQGHNYWVGFYIKDDNKAIQSVNVAGSGIPTGGIGLRYDSGEMAWVSYFYDASGNFHRMNGLDSAARSLHCHVHTHLQSRMHRMLSPHRQRWIESSTPLFQTFRLLMDRQCRA